MAAAHESSVQAPAVAKHATDDQKLELLVNHDTFVFDCDGTLWKGSKFLDGVPELMRLLRDQGKSVFFVTNSATSTRAQLVQKLMDKGVAAKIEEVYSSAHAAAVYLKALWFNKKVYVIGEAALVSELQLVGLEVLGGPDDDGKAVDWSQGQPSISVDPQVGAVVVGLDRGINYYKLQYATRALLVNPGCIFIATNIDCRSHLTTHEEWPDSGTMVAAIIGSSEVEPTVVGSPSPIMMDAIRRVSGVAKHRMCIIGDRLDTDIVWGLQNGCTTVLVLSGVTSEQQLLSPTNDIRPKLVLDAVGDLLTVRDKMPYSSCAVQ